MQGKKPLTFFHKNLNFIYINKITKLYQDEKSFKRKKLWWVEITPGISTDDELTRKKHEMKKLRNPKILKFISVD